LSKSKIIPNSWRWAAVGFLLLVTLNHFVADWISTNTKSSKINWLIEQAPPQADWVVLGSSAALASIDPAVLSTELGKDVLMLAEEGAAYPEQELIWKLLMERCRSKALLLEVDAWGVTNVGYSWPFHEYHYLTHVNHPIVEKAIAEQKGPWLTAAWKYIPMLKFAQFNSKFGIVQLPSFLKGTSFDPRRAGTNETTTTIESLAEDCKTELMTGWEWDRNRINALEGILELAKANSVRVFLYYSPIYKNCRVHEEEKIKGFYRELAAKKNIPLIFIEDESILGQAENFKDITHMNSRGANRFTKTIAERIRSTDPKATE
jgi:hypothetical protein